MNIQIARSNTTPRVRRSIAFMSTLLVGTAIAVGLASPTGGNVTSTAIPATNRTAAWERFAAFKQVQAEAYHTTEAPAPIQTTGMERFTAMKERQAQARDPLATTQATPMRISGQARFAELKDRQAEQSDHTTMVTVAARTIGWKRFVAFKQAQAELREAGSR